ncbi:MAG: glycyl-radical enzyme activating protein [Rectinemataceae bacterium]|jgi:pyruvate formate lyase activating enzyme
MAVSGTIFDLRELTVHDGPGIRSTVFFKGCPLHCAWCHNPEGISFEPELMVRKKGCRECGLCRRACGHPDCERLGRCVHCCPLGLVSASGERITAESLAERMLGVADMLDPEGGGYTISGGEPLAQPEFLFELIERLKPHHVAIETSGSAASGDFRRAMELADLMILDVKHMDGAEHRRGTGQGNETILRNLDGLVASGRHFWVRIPMIPGYNDSPANLAATAERLTPAAGRVRVELLGYNPLAGAKYPMLGRPYAPFFDESSPIRADLSPFHDRGIEALWRQW